MIVVATHAAEAIRSSEVRRRGASGFQRRIVMARVVFKRRDMQRV
jgi:hypothetical protein